MSWVAFIALCLMLFGALGYRYRRDRRAERRPTRDAVGPQLRREIAAEREAALARRKKFLDALSDAVRRTRKS
ncbi:MAG: hypothetical protein HY543_10750 [Deltaproteobacteria bacterium]|nr:hypothetical protein [Deltaproteobacteria bacterium]